MKIMIASDIHGSEYYCDLLLKAFYKENPQTLLLLGDILYHGPRNDLPKDYNPKAVIEKLNSIKDNIFSVRGNCDAEVDQMVLDFPLMADYSLIPCENVLIYATHGHIYNESNLSPHGENFALLCGHTHIPKVEKHNGFLYVNPGSVSIPKEQSPHSYIVFDGNTLLWKDLESGKEFLNFKL